jgi:hypothetical protein
MLLGPGARRWLLAVENRNPGELGRYSLDAQSQGQARGVITALMAGIMGRRLATWDW